MKPATCDGCGAPVDRDRDRCEYCGRPYEKPKDLREATYYVDNRPIVMCSAEEMEHAIQKSFGGRKAWRN